MSETAVCRLCGEVFRGHVGAIAGEALGHFMLTHSQSPAIAVINTAMLDLGRVLALQFVRSYEGQAAINAGRARLSCDLLASLQTPADLAEIQLRVLEAFRDDVLRRYGFDTAAAGVGLTMAQAFEQAYEAWRAELTAAASASAVPMALEKSEVPLASLVIQP